MPYGLYPDRVKESLTSASTGPSTFTLNGAATGYRTFAAANIPTGRAVDVCIAMDDGSAWQTCEITISGSTITVGVIYTTSTGSTSALTFAAGAKSCFVAVPSNDFERYWSMGQVQAAALRFPTT